jgi:hypothetical protein
MIETKGWKDGKDGKDFVAQNSQHSKVFLRLDINFDEFLKNIIQINFFNNWQSNACIFYHSKVDYFLSKKIKNAIESQIKIQIQKIHNRSCQKNI